MCCSLVTIHGFHLSSHLILSSLKNDDQKLLWLFSGWCSAGFRLPPRFEKPG